jgi:hypothetical protein
MKDYPAHRLRRNGFSASRRYPDYFPGFLAAQIFFAAAEIFARASALILRFFFAGFGSAFAALSFAQRAFCAAAMAARPAAEIPPRFFLVALGAGAAMAEVAVVVFSAAFPNIRFSSD